MVARNIDFFLIGMFRSGTTFVSNIINSNKNGHCIYDPTIFIFKTFRNMILKRHFKSKVFNSTDDLPDYYFSKYTEEYLNFVVNEVSFKEKINNYYYRQIKDQLMINKIYQHPEIGNQLIKQENFLGLLNNLVFKISKDFYSNKKYNVSVLGTKTSWCEEFIPALLRANKKLKVIFLIRKLEDIIYSGLHSENLSESAVRPIMYYILYWKKSYFFLNYLKKKLTKHNLFFLKYESINSDNIKRLYNYLNLSINDSHKRLIDQDGKFFKKNTSFSKIKKKKNYELCSAINSIVQIENKNLNYAIGYKEFDLEHSLKIIMKHEKKLINTRTIKKKYHNYLLIDNKKINVFKKILTKKSIFKLNEKTNYL